MFAFEKDLQKADQHFELDLYIDRSSGNRAGMQDVQTQTDWLGDAHLYPAFR